MEEDRSTAHAIAVANGLRKASKFEQKRNELEMAGNGRVGENEIGEYATAGF